ncbi:MAG: hypothetical protein QHC90_24960 [Shinella sp.]|nr:hypothetical protein [Shinella sp.]
MNSKPVVSPTPSPQTRENIAYIRQMLGELRTVANAEGAEMLRYFLEMAYVEAGDIQTGLRPLSVWGEGNKPSGVPVKPSGKVKL